MTEMQTLDAPAKAFSDLSGFVSRLRFEDIPPNVITAAKLLVLDLIGVLAAADKMEASPIARDHAVRHWSAGPGGPSAKLLFDGRPVSLPGFGFAMATQIDNLDAHDGWQDSKGHAGAALFPALAAFGQDAESVSGREALVCMIIGYELSYRVAVALHGTVLDYHTSGAWNALGCAAIGARLRKADDAVLRSALGIAEYHGPRSQMMREIANPSMLHDGSGFGAPVGIYGLLISEEGFVGSPAATIEFDDAAQFWGGLGERWLTAEQYIKPYPICRWSHAPIDAALQLRELHGLTTEMIAGVDIHTFENSAALNCDVPENSVKAQYSLAWPVAAALVRGRVGVDEILPEAFSDPDLIKVTGLTSAHVDADIEPTFPNKRLARLSVRLNDGRVLDSGLVEASGGPNPQPTEAEVVGKFRHFAGSVMPPERAESIITATMALDHEGSDFKALLDDLTGSFG